MACPITHKCYKTLSRQFFTSSQRYLYEDLWDNWVEFGEEIQRDEPSEQALRLRGFYVVEVLFYILSSSWSGPPFGKPRILRNTFQPPERSAEGLTRVISQCEEEISELAADQGEMELLGDEGEDATWKLLVEQMDKPKAVLTACAKAATVLRANLRGGTKCYASLGHLFAVALVRVNCTPETCLLHLTTLLRISLHNPVSPFNGVRI